MMCARVFKLLFALHTWGKPQHECKLTRGIFIFQHLLLLECVVLNRNFSPPAPPFFLLPICLSSLLLFLRLGKRIADGLPESWPRWVVNNSMSMPGPLDIPALSAKYITTWVKGAKTEHNVTIVRRISLHGTPPMNYRARIFHRHAKPPHTHTRARTHTTLSHAHCGCGCLQYHQQLQQ